MSPPASELRRRWVRWLVPGAALALAPKCVLCVAAYFGLGTTLGWAGEEICGAPDNATPHGLGWLAIGATALGVGVLVAKFARCLSAAPGKPDTTIRRVVGTWELPVSERFKKSGPLQRPDGCVPARGVPGLNRQKQPPP